MKMTKHEVTGVHADGDRLTFVVDSKEISVEGLISEEEWRQFFRGMGVVMPTLPPELKRTPQKKDVADPLPPQRNWWWIVMWIALALAFLAVLSGKGS